MQVGEGTEAQNGLQIARDESRGTSQMIEASTLMATRFSEQPETHHPQIAEHPT